MLSTLRKAGLVLALSLAAMPQAARAEDGWTENYAQAQVQAKKEHKRMLLDFTGSDWCTWCIKLDKEIFSQDAFKSYAKKNLILVKLDFPHSKPQSAEVKKQNEALSNKYNIEGYPTVYVLDESGKTLGTLGYMHGGPSAFIKALDALKK